VLFYGKRSEGYAAGLFNPGSIDRNAVTPATTEAALTPAYPEETTAYELGIKSMLLNSRLRFNAALFYSDSENLQLSDIINNVRITYNSGEANSQGVEIDILVLLEERLTANLSYGYLDVAFNVKGDKNNDGLEDQFFQVTPKNTASAGIEYEHPFASSLFTLRFDATFKDDFGLAYTSKKIGNKKRTLFNMRCTLSEIKAADGQFIVAVWGRNLTDEEYRSHSVDFNNYTASIWGEPRSVGIDLAWEF